METIKEVGKYLPERIKENFDFLQEKLKKEDVSLLNPITVEILGIKKKAESLVLVKNEEGEFDENCIKEYKSLKAEIRSFNGKLTKSAKQLKDPYLKIQKSIIAIEKGFKEISSDIQKNILDRFSEYEEEQKRIKEEKQRKKDEALLKEIEDSKKEAEELKKKNLINEVYNSILNKEINENIVLKTMNTISTANLETIKSLKLILEAKDFSLFKNKYDISLLPNDLMFELKKKFSDSIINSINLINDKIKNIQTEKEKEKLEAFNEFNKEKGYPLPGNNISSTEEILLGSEDNLKNVSSLKETNEENILKQLNNEDFYKYVKKELILFKKILIEKLDESKVPDPYLYILKVEFNKIDLK